MKISFATILLVLISFSTGTVAIADNAKLSYRQNKIVYQAQKALEVSDALQCTRIVEQYLTEHDSAPYQFFSLLGTCQYHLQDYSAATRAFENAFALAPQNAEISLGLATSRYLQEDYSGAGQQFATTHRLSPNKDHQLLYQSAMSFYMAKDYHQAKTKLKQLLKVSPVDDSSWNELLLSCYMELKEWPEARDHLQKLLVKKPEHEPYWRLLAQLHLQQQDYKQAAYAMEVVSRLKPAEEDLKVLAGLYNYLNIPLRAADLLAQAYGADPAAEQIEELAGLYLRGYDYRKASAVLRQGLERWPESAALKTLSTQLLYQQGRYRELLKVAKSGSRNDAQASLLNGYAAWHLGQWRQAKRFFRQALGDTEYRTQSRHALEVLDLLLQAATEDAEGQHALAQLPQ